MRQITKDDMRKVKEFLMTTTNGMAIGLFGTLIIGVIIEQFSKIDGLGTLKDFALLIQSLMGAGIGLGVALSLKKEGVAVVTLMAAGMAGTLIFSFSEGAFELTKDPLSAYVCTLFALFGLSLLKRKTPVDMILVPLVGLAFAILYCYLCSDAVHHVSLAIGWVIEASFDIAPLPMCIVVCVLVGMALTAPISSVAICVVISIGNVPLAAGAAVIGCCVQMLGFAVQTAYDNKAGAVIAVAIGTSMLQFKNIIRKPVVWLPTIIVSALLAPFAYIFEFASSSVGAGMGTSGLVGILETFSKMDYDPLAMFEVVMVCIVAAVVLVFIVDRIFRSMGWIEKGDFALQSDI